MGVGNEEEPVLGVVEGHERIVKMKLRIGQFRLARMPVGNILDIADRIVAEVAHGAAGQRRQAGNRYGNVGIYRILQDLEEIT